MTCRKSGRALPKSTRSTTRNSCNSHGTDGAERRIRAAPFHPRLQFAIAASKT
jgi:hypothetical protein